MKPMFLTNFDQQMTKVQKKYKKTLKKVWKKYNFPPVTLVNDFQKYTEKFEKSLQKVQLSPGNVNRRLRKVHKKYSFPPVTRKLTS